MISEMPFPSIKYEELFDPITRLKELFDYNFPIKGRLGKYEFIISPVGAEDNDESDHRDSLDDSARDQGQGSVWERISKGKGKGRRDRTRTRLF